MSASPEKIKIPSLMDGTTAQSQKIPLILKEFFKKKTTDNEKSIA